MESSHGQSEGELVDVMLDGLDLAGEFLVLVRRNASGNDGPGNAASAAQCSLGRNEDVRHVLWERDEREHTLPPTKRQLTFSSQRSGRWSKISRGSVSAVKMMISAIPRLSVLVASRK